MNHFQAFCKATPKNEHGYMPDIIDLASDAVKDWAVVSYLRDIGDYSASEFYFLTVEQKNAFYAKYESSMQDEVDKFNQAIDDAKESALLDDRTMISLCDPEYKWQHFNQAMYDHGHKESDFA